MIENIIALSLLILAVIFIRAIFKSRVSARLVYILWLSVVLKLLVPFGFIGIDLPEMPSYEPVRTESTFQKSEEPMDGDLVTQEPSIQEHSEQMSPAVNNSPKYSATATEKKLTAEDVQKILLATWAGGSALAFLAFCTYVTVFSVRLLRNRRYYGKAGKIKVYVTDKVHSPCVFGLIPAIYVTPDACECEGFSLILLHESTHVRHGDHLWSFLRIICLCVYWWNPFIWAAALLSERDSELACDESVAKKLCQNERLTYSRLIVDMIPKKHGLTVAFTSSPVKERLLRLTSKSKTKVVFSLLAVTLVLWASLCSFLTDDNDPNKDNATAPENSLSATHTHSYESATCSLSAMCDCGAVEGEPLGHVWQAATCTSPATCQRCGITDGLPLEHSWTAATCDSSKSCSVCSITEGEHLNHELIAATCTTPAYCSLCHKTYDSALGHSFTAATCTSPAICTRCSYAEGYALGHNYDGGKCTRCASKDESYKETVQEGIVITPFSFSDGSEQLEKSREWHEKYDDTDDSDDSWKYGYDTPTIDNPIRWDFGSNP